MTRPISLLVVSTSLNTGGAQRFTSTLLTHLDRALVRPSLALLRDDIGFSLPGDVPLHQLQYRRGWHVFSAAGRLRRVIDETRPDILLSNTTATNLVTGLALRSCHHQPYWIARVGTCPRRHDSVVRSSLAQFVYRRVDQFAANSLGLGRDLPRKFPVAGGRTSVFPNPTDFAAIEDQSTGLPDHVWGGSEPLLIAVGRLYPEKRYDVMVDAFARIRSEYKAKLWICGEGPERKRLERQIRRHGIGNEVELLGFCPNPYALMKQATLFMMSSDHEGLPNALIEAQGLGIPAVSTRCPHGPEDVIEDGRTGLLVPTGDRRELAAAALSLLGSPDRIRSMGESARQVMRRRFAVGPLINQWHDLFEQAAQGVAAS